MRMKLQRFEALAEAYGADLRLWPEAERAAAIAVLATAPEAQDVLEKAEGLDALMALAPRPVASMDLRERVLASAAGGGLRQRAGRGRSWGALAWLSGLGWAAAAFAGIAFGFNIAGVMTADLQADVVFYQASLNGADDTEVLGG